LQPLADIDGVRLSQAVELGQFGNIRIMGARDGIQRVLSLHHIERLLRQLHTIAGRQHIGRLRIIGIEQRAQRHFILLRQAVISVAFTDDNETAFGNLAGLARFYSLRSAVQLIAQAPPDTAPIAPIFRSGFLRGIFIAVIPTVGAIRSAPRQTEAQGDTK
jgi:hypothetical protein